MPNETAISQGIRQIGNDLFQRVVGFDHGDDETNDLMLRVWIGTPWMKDFYTGPSNERLDRDMREWCRDRWGREHWPIHALPGLWQRGGVTLNGWTWYGFATQEMLAEFEAEFGCSQPDGLTSSDTTDQS